MASSINWSDLVRNTATINVAKSLHTQLVGLSSNVTVKEALKELANKNILSAPVVSNTSGEFLGFIDVLDIAGFVLHTYRRQQLSVGYPNSGSNKSIDDFFNTEIAQVINFSQSNYPVYVMESSPFHEILDAMGGNLRVFKPHRVAIMSTSNVVQNIITQSDVIAYAAKNLNTISSTVWGNKTLSELGLPHSPIEVRIDTHFSDALRILYDNRVSGIALVDHEGRLSGNLSASDLRGIMPESFDYFTGSTLQFLVKGSSTARPHAPITCSPDTKLVDAIKLIAENRIHRLYIVNENERPVGIVSISDIIQVLRI